MRLFVAAEVPEKIKERMGELEAELPSEGLKKVNPLLMHITLKFLGEVEDAKVPGVEAGLSSVEFAPFNVGVKGVGVFPSESYVRVVWAGLEGEGLGTLAEKVEEALSGMFKREARGFSAHLTLARVRKKVELGKFLEKHKDEAFGEFEVDRFVLMRSILKRPEPEYSVVAEFRAKFK